MAVFDFLPCSATNLLPTVVRQQVFLPAPFLHRQFGFELIAQGIGGIMHVTGEPDRPPTLVGLPRGRCEFGSKRFERNIHWHRHLCRHAHAIC